jgi:Zn-dependent M28 family amino/carboxypeptidase
MELARLLAPLSGQLRRTVRFETYAAEEIGLSGSTRYVNGMSDSDVAQLAFMLNLDGGALSGDRGLVLQGLRELHPLFAAFAREMGYHLSLADNVSTASDHYPYFLRGVPCASLVGNRPLSLGRGFGHTRADTLDKVDEVELRESAMVAARLLLRLADHPDSIGRKRTPAEIRQILLGHNLEEPLKAQGEWPFD